MGRLEVESRDDGEGEEEGGRIGEVGIEVVVV